jgi:hypothetical protein
MELAIPICLDSAATTTSAAELLQFHLDGKSLLVSLNKDEATL